jgi:hypothetical protein
MWKATLMSSTVVPSLRFVVQDVSVSVTLRVIDTSKYPDLQGVGSMLVSKLNTGD